VGAARAIAMKRQRVGRTCIMTIIEIAVSRGICELKIEVWVIQCEGC
jgi:hypothetical protein